MAQVRPQIVDERDGLAFQVLVRYVARLQCLNLEGLFGSLGVQDAVVRCSVVSVEEAKTGVHSFINTSNLDIV